MTGIGGSDAVSSPRFFDPFDPFGFFDRVSSASRLPPPVRRTIALPRAATSQRMRRSGVAGILWAILAVVILVWLLGLILGTVGSLIHILLIVAAVILVYNLWSSRRGV